MCIFSFTILGHIHSLYVCIRYYLIFNIDEIPRVNSPIIRKIHLKITTNLT